MTLTEEQQRACWVDLAARVGRMSVAHAEEGMRGLTVDLARLVMDFAGVVRSYGPRLALGDISESDQAEWIHARENLRRLVSSAHTMIEEVSQAIGDQESKGTSTATLRRGGVHG